MLERFLERISASTYKNNFILKGGMLIAAMIGIDTRTTMDMDAIIKGKMLTKTQIHKIIKDILNVSIDDNVIFLLREIEEINEESNYPGYRVSIEAQLDKTRQIMHVDITTGDFITPREIEYSFKLMFEDRAIRILTYNLETVLAEKFETVITRGLANTRMRDFYDIHVLTSTYKIDTNVFYAALKNTTIKRKTTTQMTVAKDIIGKITASRTMKDLWIRYQKNYKYASDVSWDTATSALRKLMSTLSHVNT